MSKHCRNCLESLNAFAQAVWGGHHGPRGSARSASNSRSSKLANAMRGLMAPLGLAVLLICSLHPGLAMAQVTFNEEVYRQLVDADSPDTVPVGTKITVANWQQYKKFLPVSVQALFSGQYRLHIGPEPMYTIEVGPTHDFPQPGEVAKNTEKYSSQVKLEKLPSGGMLMTGYVAGIPFPNPQEPNRGIKVLYNDWTRFKTNIVHNSNVGFLVDRYGNKSFTIVDAAFYGLSHLSEPGLPMSLPYAHGVFYATRFQLLAPEQTKYTTEITQVPEDAQRLPEVFVFLPSLRRSLRLSAAAKCSPILGTDYVQDDNSYQPPTFDVKYLGTKKLLTWYGYPNKGFLRSSYVGVAENEPPGTYPGWPKYGTGLWELRKYHVIDLRWIKSQGGYCYSHTVFYDDDQTNFSPYHDNYDNEGKLWKLYHIKWTPMTYHGVTTVFAYGYSANAMTDIENTHTSAGASLDQTLDDDAPAEFKDVHGMSDPSNLQKIMK